MGKSCPWTTIKQIRNLNELKETLGRSAKMMNNGATE